ncbi:hypothetical protein B0H14DRAFT_3151086, partial [Mycena olivaceomarginata]
MPVPFRPLCAPVPLHVHTAAIPSSHALPPSFCPPPPLLASVHPPSCRHTLVLSTDGVGMNHTAVREHHITSRRSTGSSHPATPVAPTPRRSGGPIPYYSPSAVLHPHLSTFWSALLDRFIDVFKWILPIYYAALPPADPAALATVPRGGHVLVPSGLCSVRSSAFLGVFVIIYLGMPMLPARVKTPILYLTPTIVYVVAWAVEVLANVGRASGVRDGRQRKANPMYLDLLSLQQFVPHCGSDARRSRSSQEGGRRRWIGYWQSSQPIVPAARLLLNRQPITYFGRLELSLALEGHAEAAEWEEARGRPRALSPVGCLFGVAVDVTLPRFSPADLPFLFTRPAPRRAELWVSDDAPTLFKLFWALICVSAGGLGRWAPIPVSAPHVHPLRATQPQLCFVLGVFIFYFFIVCPPIPTLDERFWIDVQAPTGVSPISPCATQGDFLKAYLPSTVTQPSSPWRGFADGHSGAGTRPADFTMTVPWRISFFKGSQLNIRVLAAVPPISRLCTQAEIRFFEAITRRTRASLDIRASSPQSVQSFPEERGVTGSSTFYPPIGAVITSITQALPELLASSTQWHQYDFIFYDDTPPSSLASKSLAEECGRFSAQTDQMTLHATALVATTLLEKRGLFSRLDLRSRNRASSVHTPPHFHLGHSVENAHVPRGSTLEAPI